MTIQYCSDLHLEFPENKYFLEKNPLIPTGDILILAGDIVPFARMKSFDYFFDFVSNNFQFTYWIPGNHEYYYCDASKKTGILFEEIKKNVFLVNNVAVIHKNWRLIFSTLWSKISSGAEWDIEKAMNDFKVIRFGEKRFSTRVYNQLHKDSISFIAKEISKPFVGKTVVATHHVPTFLNYPTQFKLSILNGAFATELFDLIDASSIDYWIYGHHHVNTLEFKINKTKLVSNQLGYIRYNEQQGFERNKTLVFT
jgi:predicted phosphohydrolase